MVIEKVEYSLEEMEKIMCFFIFKKYIYMFLYFQYYGFIGKVIRSLKLFMVIKDFFLKLIKNIQLERQNIGYFYKKFYEVIYEKKEKYIYRERRVLNILFRK